jgi:hypothetical protein
MTERPIAVVVAIACLAASPAGAEIHRWVDPHGVVNYADYPPQPYDVAPVAAPEPAATDAMVAVAAAAPEEARPAQEPSPGRDMTLDELFELSGLRRQLVSVTARLSREFRPMQGQLAAPAEATIGRVVARTFTSEAIYRVAREEFARGLDRPKLDAKAAWLRSPLGRKVTALEVAGAEPEHDGPAGEAAARPATADARRRELLERLDWVSGASDVSADVVVALASSVARAIARHGPPERRPSRRQLESHAEELRGRTAEPLREAALASMLRTYRALSDEELQRYVAFESTEVGRWYNALLRRALLAGLTRAFDDTTDAIFEAVPPERWAPATTAAR